MKKKVESKVIVLTGATRGLGRALAEKFAAMGHRVVACGRSKEKVAELKAALGRKGNVSTVDIGKAKAVDGWAKRVLKRFGAPDLVINNAGVINLPKNLWEIPPEEIEQLLRTNVIGTVNVARAFLPAMIEAGRGVLVNFSSGWGRGVSPGVAPYCGSKWAVEGLTQALSEELPRGLAAIPLNPGIVDTDMLRAAWGEGADRFPKPAEWAESVAPFLLSLGPEHNGQPLNAPY